VPLELAPENRGDFIARTNRGVAVGDGKVYLATLDAKLWALDAKTGEPVPTFGSAGSTKVADVFAGYFLTAAPVFVSKSLVPNGGPSSGHNLVLIGTAGSENEVRGYMNAYDADTGKLVWRFFTVPDPGQTGSDTWSVISEGPFAEPYLRGGGAPWMSPAYDPDLGLVIFGTGNAGPDYEGTHRAGDNLYANCVIAVDVRTGKRVWHFQEVHHDVWDYDQSASPVLFEVKRNGKPIKAVGAAGKTGWFYILDRLTGEPLVPCPERPVPGSSSVAAADGFREKLSPTQPYCESDPFVPQGGRTLPSGAYVSPIFTPPAPPTPGASGPYLFPSLSFVLGTKPVYDQLNEPGNLGGSDWTPTSFNPHLGLAYIGGNVLPIRPTAFTTEAPTKTGNLGGWFSWTVQEQLYATGTLTAMDVESGKIKWQVRTQSPVIGGTCATAGNLVFLGDADDDPANPLMPLSYFSAFDAQTGERLFRYRVPNDVPIIAPCVAYAVDGDEFIAVAAGGWWLNPAHDNLIYVFGLRK
jgi:alcohol dehydrogenase (cytochrome c)